MGNATLSAPGCFFSHNERMILVALRLFRLLYQMIEGSHAIESIRLKT